MKKIFSYILITAFIFLPTLGYATIAPSTTTPKTSAQTPAVIETTDVNSPLLQGKSLTAKKKAVEIALTDIYSRLDDLSDQTQLAINQLNANGVITISAQTNLIAANTSLAKAKTDIAAFSGIVIPTKVSGTITLDTLKYTANTAENTLGDVKKHLIESLNSLKATLPTIDTLTQ